MISVVGAPVSKISRYGPLPLSFTLTIKCPLETSSNGTDCGLASSLAAGLSSAADQRRRQGDEPARASK